MLAGDPTKERAKAEGTIQGDIFGASDDLAFSPGSGLWIRNDAQATQMCRGEFAPIGNIQWLACGPVAGETRR